MFADVKVVAFDFFLGAFDAAGDEAVLDWHVVGDIEHFHDAFDAVGAEFAHEVVFHGGIELAEAGVALTAGATAELVVDAAGFVAFGADDTEAAEGFDFVVDFDVGTAAGHVCGDGDGAAFAGVGDDFGFFGVVFSVEDAVIDASFDEEVAEDFGFFDGDGADEDGLAAFVDFFHFLDEGGEFAALVFEDEVDFILAVDGFVGGDDDRFEAVNLVEFFFFGFGGSGHAGEFFK